MTLTTASDSADNLTPSAARIYAALRAAPGSKVIEVARAAGTANSTTANQLKQMEQDGLARRTRGGSDGNRILPDRWYPAATAAPAGPQEVESPGRNSVRAAPERPADSDEETAAPSPGQESEQSGETATPADRHGRADELNSAAQPDTAPDVSPPDAPPTGRLGQGGLRDLVRGFLDTHRETAYSPTRIARHLGRSSGAVANALVTLVNLGQAEMVTAKPRTYRLRPTPTKPS
ncbi:hypothetical protein [Streptacidiphilus neutrinimicus]|uniref:hypothetical protein n=1 Tax=Streptacidiphilus neutrinimicus TaxID=105420 RepID=UPI000AA943BB|nr:hypothetical protein [Streptacidiphilus neutrinimicus]